MESTKHSQISLRKRTELSGLGCLSCLSGLVIPPLLSWFVRHTFLEQTRDDLWVEMVKSTVSSQPVYTPYRTRGLKFGKPLLHELTPCFGPQKEVAQNLRLRPFQWSIWWRLSTSVVRARNPKHPDPQAPKNVSPSSFVSFVSEPSILRSAWPVGSIGGPAG